MNRQTIGCLLGCLAIVCGAHQAWAAASNLVGAYDPGYSTDPSLFAPLTGQFVTVEDQPDDSGLNAYLGPGYGGQAFDMEAMFVTKGVSALQITIISGVRPDNGFANYCPGDIFISLSNGSSIGIEVGGGPGSNGGPPVGPIVQGAPGSNYQIDGNGYTLAHLFSDPAQVAGSIWLNPNWISSPLFPGILTQFVGEPGGLLGVANYSNTRDATLGVHSTIQVDIPLIYFGGATATAISIAPSCGNDYLDLRLVPEPDAFSLLVIGALALIMPPGTRRRIQS